MVPGEVGMGQHFHESGKAHGMDGRDAGKRLGVELAVTCFVDSHKAQLAVALRHQHVAVGEPGQAPGMPQASGDHRGADGGLARFLGFVLTLRLALRAGRQQNRRGEGGGREQDHLRNGDTVLHGGPILHDCFPRFKKTSLPDGRRYHRRGLVCNPQARK